MPQNTENYYNNGVLEHTRNTIFLPVSDEEEYWARGIHDVATMLLLHTPSPLETAVVMDYGCGNGRMSAAMAPQVAQLIACDMNYDVLTAAFTQLTLIRGLPNISYVTADRAQLHYHTSVDFLYCYQVLQHCLQEQVYEAVQMIAAVLKPTGCAMIHFPGLEQRPEYPVTGRCRCYLREEIEELLAPYFSSIKIHTTHKEYVAECHP